MMVVFGHLNPVRADGWNWTGQYAVHIVWSLLGIDSRKAGPTIAKLDEVLGDLAYPIFLSHLLVVIVVVAFGLDRVVDGSTGLILAALLPLHILAYAINGLVEVPFEVLRTRVRPS